MLRRTLAVFLLVSAAFAQYTDRQALADLGGPQEFVRRRQELGHRAGGKGVAILFARQSLPEAAHYREDNDFYYYTGAADPGAVALISMKTGELTLFEPRQSEREARVLGPNLLSLPPAEREKLGYARVQPITNLDVAFAFSLGGLDEDRTPEDVWLRLGWPDVADGARAEVGRANAALFNHPYGQRTPDNLLPNQLVRQRYPEAEIHNLTPLIDDMRNIKTPQEIEILRRNGKLSAEGQRRAIARAKPGMYQYQIEAEGSYWFALNGAQGWAYPAIVGSGENVNTWHYFSNRNRIEPNELVVFDFGADLHHETMDITRTFNISGKFTPEQAKWYAVDLEGQKAIIAMLKPGNTYEQATEAGEKVFKAAGVENQLRGFPGHFVGLGVHDVFRPSGPIKVGQVVTVEPIVEFPEKRMHFRVEDTVLITERGPEILSSGVPKEIADVERLVGSEAKQ